MGKFLIGLALAAALVACGGGSDSPRNTPAAATFPLQSAYQAYIRSAHVYSYDLDGSCGGSGSENISPPATGTFLGGPALVTTTTLVLNHDTCTAFGATPIPAPGTNTIVGQTFYDANLRPLGESVPAQNLTIIYTNTTPIPTLVKVGDSAVLTSGSAGSISFVVEADTETSVFVKLITISMIGGQQNSATATYRLTSDGVLALVRQELVLADGLTFVLTPR